MLCRALAKECDVRMLQVAPSDVKDMYVGETEKLVRAIFVSFFYLFFLASFC